MAQALLQALAQASRRR
ncbi:hypothetical protein [Burkholderia multivorans]